MSPTDVHSDDTEPRERAERTDGAGHDASDGASSDGSSDDASDSASSDDGIEQALDAFRAGEPVCVHDFDDREGETDLCYPAAAVDADAVARLRNDAGGLVCVALADAVADAADLPLFADAIDHPAVEDADLAYGDRSSFSFTVNHRDTYTGITDEDRALTISELGAFAASVADGAFGDSGDASSDEGSAFTGAGFDADDPTAAFADAFRVPGHVHLLRAAPGGLAERRGHTELALALADAAGVAPAVVVCEMLDDETGDALSVADARAYAERTDTPFLEGERVVDALE